MKVKLGEICNISSAKRIFEKEYVAKGIPFIRGLEISNGSILNESASFECYISKERYEELKRVYGVPQKGDILITAVGTIGKLCYIDRDREFYFKDGNIIWLKDIQKNIYPPYLYYFMKSPFFKNQLEYAMIGAVQKALTMIMLEKIEIELPDYEMQISIATILACIDSKIENNKKINQELESMVKTIYDYWFLQFEFPNEEGKPYKSSGGKMVWNEELKREIPEDWSVDSLGSLFTSKRGISYNSKTIEGNGVPMINLASFNIDGSYKAGGIKTYSGQYSADKIVKPYDLLMCNTQQTAIDFNKDIIGKAMLVPDIFEGDIVTSHHVTTIKVKEDNLKYYLYRLFNTDYFHKYVAGFTNGTNILGLIFSGIERYRLEIPDDATANNFTELMADIERKKSKIIKENQELVSLRDFLLPLLMNGQVGFKD